MAEVKLTVRTNFTEAEKELQKLGGTVQATMKTMTEAEKALASKNIDQYLDKQSRLATAMSITRGQAESNVTLQRNLRNEYEKLYRQGIDPTSAGMMKLESEYRRVTAAVMANNVQVDKNGKEYSKLSEGFSRVKTALGAMAAAVGVGIMFDRLKDSIMGGVKANEWLIESDTRLYSIATKVTKATEEEVQAMRDLADATELRTAHEAEAVKVGMSQLLTFGMSAKSAMALNVAMGDLAASQRGLNVKGTDMVDTANMIGKAFMGQTGAMTRAGVTLSDTQKQMIQYGTEAERVATITAVINQNFGGLAESLRNTSKGAIAMMKHDLGTLQESMSAGLLPVLGVLAKTVSNLLATNKLTTDTNATLELFKMLGRGVVYFGRASDIVFTSVDMAIKGQVYGLDKLKLKYSELAYFMRTKIPVIGMSDQEKKLREQEARANLKDAMRDNNRSKKNFDEVSDGIRERLGIYKDTLNILDKLKISQEAVVTGGMNNGVGSVSDISSRIVAGSGVKTSGKDPAKAEEEKIGTATELTALSDKFKMIESTEAIHKKALLDQSTQFWAQESELSTLATEEKIAKMQSDFELAKSMKLLENDEIVAMEESLKTRIQAIKDEEFKKDQERKMLQMQIMNTYAGGVAQTFSNLATVAKNMGGQSRAMLVASKLFGVAQIGIATKIAVMKAMADMEVPFALRVANAVTVGAMGVSNALAVATTPIPSAETGIRDFTVPDSTRVDSSYMKVNQGEKLTVTPRGEDSSKMQQTTVMLDGRVILRTVQEFFDNGELRVNDFNIAGAY